MRHLWFVFLLLVSPALAQDVAPRYTLAGMQLVPSSTTYANDLQGTLQLPISSTKTIPVTFHLDSNGTLTSAFSQTSFPVEDNGFTFTVRDVVYDSKRDLLIGDATITGQDVPGRVVARDVELNSKGILKVGQVTSDGWGTAHELWDVGANAQVTPDGLVWKDNSLQVHGLLLQGKFHADVACKVEKGNLVGVEMDGDTTVLHENRVVWVDKLLLKNEQLYAGGETGLPDGSRFTFKDVLINPDGSLDIQFPISNKQAALAAAAGMMDLMAAAPQPGEPTEDPFAPSTALRVAQASGLEILTVEGAPNLQMVVTQSSGDTVDGFVPLMDWVGQANVYGAKRSGNSVQLSAAEMSWLKKEVQPPYSGVGLVQLQDPVVLNTATGRLSSPATALPSMRGFTADVLTWEVDTKEFRFECGNFSAINGKFNPMGPGALFQGSMSTTGEGVSVQGAQPIPPDVPVPDRYGPIDAGYQGGAEFDIVFLEDGEWGFEMRTAMPQINFGGPDWMRQSTVSPKGAVWPTLFTKIYMSGYTFFNLVCQGLSIPIGDTGLAFTNPGMLFFYEPTTTTFFFELQTLVTIVDVDSNIFSCSGRLYVDGSGMGKSGGGEVTLAGYVFDIEVSEFDVGFASKENPDGSREEEFALTVPIFSIFGFSLECSGEVKVHPPPGDWFGAVSGYIKIPIIGKIGVTFYAYLHPFKLHMHWGGHDFHVDSGGNGQPTYTGPFDLVGLHWYGTEAVDTSKGSVDVTGKTDITGSSSDGGSLTATLAITNAVLSEEGLAQANLTTSDLAIVLKPSGNTVSLTKETPTFQLNSAQQQFVATISDVPVTIGKWSGKVELDLTLNTAGMLTAALDLPGAQGGTYTQQFNLSSKGDTN